MEASREEDGHHAEGFGRNVTVREELVDGPSFHRADRWCTLAGRQGSGRRVRKKGPFPVSTENERGNVPITESKASEAWEDEEAQNVNPGQPGTSPSSASNRTQRQQRGDAFVDTENEQNI